MTKSIVRLIITFGLCMGFSLFLGYFFGISSSDSTRYVPVETHLADETRISSGARKKMSEQSIKFRERGLSTGVKPVSVRSQKRVATQDFFRGLRSRNEIGLKLQQLGFETGAEVGVQKGEFAMKTLSLWPSCKHYYVIDSWKNQENSKDLANVANDVQERFYRQTLKRLQKWQDKIRVFRTYSTKAAAQIPDKSVDYVYLDARHDYCGIKEDLVAFWPKVRPGGVLAGHDFHTAHEVKILSPEQDWSLCMDGTVNQGAVKGAVLEFANTHGLHVLKTGEKRFPSWIIVKPGAAPENVRTSVEDFDVSDASKEFHDIVENDGKNSEALPQDIIELMNICILCRSGNLANVRVKMLLNSLMLHRSGKSKPSSFFFHIFADSMCQKHLESALPSSFSNLAWYPLNEVSEFRSRYVWSTSAATTKHHAKAVLLDKLVLPIFVRRRFPNLSSFLFLDLDQIVLSPIENLFAFASELKRKNKKIKMAATCAKDPERLLEYCGEKTDEETYRCHDTIYCFTGTVMYFLSSMESDAQYLRMLKESTKTVFEAIGGIRQGDQEVFNYLLATRGEKEYGSLPPTWNCLVRDARKDKPYTGKHWPKLWRFDRCHAVHWAGLEDKSNHVANRPFQSFVQAYSNLPFTYSFGPA